MIFVSQLLDGYFKTRLKSLSFREKCYRDALAHKLRGNKIGQILLRNLNDHMARNPKCHEEFSSLLKDKDYQTAFWESDLGYMWYQGNLHAQNKYFSDTLDIIRENLFTSVLDVGCGWGTFIDRSANCPSVKKAVGIDISSNIIQEANKLHPNSKAEFVYKDILNEHNHYDLVTLFGSTDYIPPHLIKQVLEKVLEIANKKIILVNSLRKLPFEKSLELKEALEVKRYDTGYVQPLQFLLTELKKNGGVAFTVKKAGLDSVWVEITK